MPCSPQCEDTEAEALATASWRLDPAARLAPLRAFRRGLACLSSEDCACLRLRATASKRRCASTQVTWATTSAAQLLFARSSELRIERMSGFAVRRNVLQKTASLGLPVTPTLTFRIGFLFEGTR